MILEIFGQDIISLKRLSIFDTPNNSALQCVQYFYKFIFAILIVSNNISLILKYLR